MRKVPPHVGGSWLLVLAVVLVFGLVRSDAVDVHWLTLLPAAGAFALGGFVLIHHYFGGWIH